MAILTQLVDDVVVNSTPLENDRLLIGRGSDCDLQINEVAVSGHHALITRKASTLLDNSAEFYIEDQGSTNGTYVNDTRLEAPHPLMHNDYIRIAWNTFRFLDENEIENTLEQTAHILQE